MTDHLSEAAIQQYALDEEHCPAWMGEHVKACERCSIQVSNYRLVFQGVEEMEVPVIEVDVAELVLTSLGQGAGGATTMPSKGAVRKRDRSLGYWLAGAALVMTAGGWVFRSFLLYIAGDTPTRILYVLVGVSLGIALVRGLRIIGQYRHQLKNLDLT